MKLSKGFTLIELMMVIAIIGVVAAIALPAYQKYVARTQSTRVMSEVGELKTVLEWCLSQGRTALGTTAATCDPGVIPSQLLTGATQVGSAVEVGFGVPQININATTGDVSIVATFGNSAAGILRVAGTDSLTWQREGSNGSWSCTSTLPSNYKPKDC